MAEIYLDNSATTRPHGEVIELVNRVQDEAYGNPSSLHEKGIEAEKRVEAARREIAGLFGAREKEIVFTSGGTEANNLAVKGAAYRSRRRGYHLVTSPTEHPSVLNCFRFLEQEGFKVSYLPIDWRGLVDPEELAALVDRETILVSIMHVNNEVGTIQPLEELGPAIKGKNPGCLFHVDAVQSFARIPMKVKDWQADLVSCSSHKIHGPKGAGCLWIKEGTLLQPLFHGGGQEGELRPGTESVAAIAGFGLAASLTGNEREQKAEHLRRLKLAFLEKLKASGTEFCVNGPPPEEGAPHIINLSFPGLKAEVILHSLEERGIYASAGSACHSRRPDPSHVLKALELDEKRLDSALRFSFSAYNTREETETAASETAAVVKELASLIN